MNELLVEQLPNFSSTKLPGSYHSLLLSGPTACGKTSLLFRIACGIAYAGGHVLFITDRSRLVAKPPYFCVKSDSETVIQSWSTLPAYLKRIDMKYFDTSISQVVSSRERMIEYFCHLHSVEHHYQMIVVDDFDMYFPGFQSSAPAMQSTLALTLALMENIRAHISDSIGRVCRLVLSINAADLSKMQNKHILLRTITDVYQVSTREASAATTGVRDHGEYELSRRTRDELHGKGCDRSGVSLSFRPKPVQLNVNETFVPYASSALFENQGEGIVPLDDSITYRLDDSRKILRFIPS